MDQTLSEVMIPGAAGNVPVSVVIPCYRCCETIKIAVESVVKQTARPMEIILVEDCSGDGGQTFALLKAISTEFQSLIRIVVLPLSRNLGAGEARNAGWSAADQEFVAFLDADDTWHPKKLEIQIAWMRAHPDFVLTCHDSKIYSENSTSQSLLNTFPERLIAWRLMLFRNEIATRTVVLRRHIAQRFQAGVRYAEDYQLWLKILLSGEKGVRLCLPLASSYKEEFGAGGLSGDLGAMHLGVMRCFDDLHKNYLISRRMHFLAVTFEVLKHWRRIAITTIRRWKSP